MKDTIKLLQIREGNVFERLEHGEELTSIYLGKGKTTVQEVMEHFEGWTEELVKKFAEEGAEVRIDYEHKELHITSFDLLPMVVGALPKGEVFMVLMNGEHVGNVMYAGTEKSGKGFDVNYDYMPMKPVERIVFNIRLE